MGCYLFQNGNVYFATRGKAGGMPWDEFLASDMTHDRQAHVLVLESEGDARFDLVRRCREIFSRGSIRTLVPYAEALRAFFRVNALAQPDEDFMVVDDLGDKVLLTVFRGGRTAIARMISVQDPSGIMEEIRRTNKNIQEKEQNTPGRPAARVFSNHAGLEGTVFFATRFPAFDVLGKVKFQPILLPEEVAASKKRVMRTAFVKMCTLAILLGGAGVGTYIYADHGARVADARVHRLSGERATLEEVLCDLGRSTYRSTVKQLPMASFAVVFERFLNNAPPEGEVVAVMFERGPAMTWGLTGTVIFPRQVIFPFPTNGVFHDAVIGDIYIQGKPGLNVRVKLPEKQEVD